MPDSQESSPGTKTPWLAEVMSPYGLSDEDATLRQADSAKWRTLFGGRSKSKRFVPVRSGKQDAPLPSPLRQAAPAEPMQRFQRESSPTPRITQNFTQKTLTSVIVGQAFFAGLLLVGALYVNRTQSQTATELKHFLRSVYQQDYSNEVVPTVQNWLSHLHWTSLHSMSLGSRSAPTSATSGNTWL